MRRTALLMVVMLASVFVATGAVFAQGSTTYPGYGDADPAAGGDTARSGPTTDLSATAVVSNGGFEAGDLSGWTVRNQQPAGDGELGSGGDWFAYSGTTSPLGATIAAPPRGSFAATTDQTDPGTHVLFKNIILESDMRHRLSYFLYYKNEAGDFYPRNTLDYTGRRPNQQYRVDVLRPKSDPFTTDPDAILATVFRTEAGDPLELAPELRTFDLTPFAGRTVRLRFAEVDNQNYFRASVDQVKVTSVSR